MGGEGRVEMKEGWWRGKEAASALREVRCGSSEGDPVTRAPPRYRGGRTEVVAQAVHVALERRHLGHEPLLHRRVLALHLGRDVERRALVRQHVRLHLLHARAQLRGDALRRQRALRALGCKGGES